MPGWQAQHQHGNEPQQSSGQLFMGSETTQGKRGTCSHVEAPQNNTSPTTSHSQQRGSGGVLKLLLFGEQKRFPDCAHAMEGGWQPRQPYLPLLPVPSSTCFAKSGRVVAGGGPSTGVRLRQSSVARPHWQVAPRCCPGRPPDSPAAASHLAFMATESPPAAGPGCARRQSQSGRGKL